MLKLDEVTAMCQMPQSTTEERVFIVEIFIETKSYFNRSETFRV